MNKIVLIPLGLIAAVSLSATALPPGGTVFGGALTANIVPAPSYDGVTSSAYSTGGAIGNLQQAVKKISNTEFHFYYQIVSSPSTSAITSLLLSGFAGYTVDVSHQNTNPNPGAPFSAPASGSVPFGVFRSPSGSEITSAYIPFGVGGAGNPAVSTILILKVTDAQGFTTLTPNASGTINGSRLLSQFAPTPEPAFYAAVTLGLAGLFLARRRQQPSK